MDSKNYNIAKETVDKTKKIYDLIAGNFIFTNIKDADVTGSESSEYVSSVLIPILTGIVGGKQLIFGNPGNGKTTTTELVSSLLYGFPLNTVISSAESHGHPEITAEDIFGSLSMPDMKNMNWSPFTQFPYSKIVDEITRLSGKQQDMLLNLADRGVSKYLDKTLITPKTALYATANYEDSGNTEIIPPLKDRFDVSTEMHQLGPLERILLKNKSYEQSILEDKGISDEITAELAKSAPYEEKLKRVDELSKQFSKNLESKLDSKFGAHSYRAISHEELSKTREYIASIPFSQDADIYLAVIHSELARPDGKERIPGREDIAHDSHYKNTEYAFNKVRKDVSNRFTDSLAKYSRAYAWFEMADKVESKHISVVLPYVLAHRVIFTDTLKAGKDRVSSLEAAKQVSDEILERYSVNTDGFRDAYGLFASAAKKDIKEKDIKEIIVKLDSLGQISDHPFIEQLKMYLKSYT